MLGTSNYAFYTAQLISPPFSISLSLPQQRGTSDLLLNLRGCSVGAVVLPVEQLHLGVQQLLLDLQQGKGRR